MPNKAKIATEANRQKAAESGSPEFDDRPLSSSELINLNKTNEMEQQAVKMDIGARTAVKWKRFISMWIAFRQRDWVPGSRLPRGKALGKTFASKTWNAKKGQYGVDSAVITRGIQAMTWWFETRKVDLQAPFETLNECRPANLDDMQRFCYRCDQGEKSYDRKFNKVEDSSTLTEDEKYARALRQLQQALRRYCNNGGTVSGALTELRQCFEIPDEKLISLINENPASRADEERRQRIEEENEAVAAMMAASYV